MRYPVEKLREVAARSNSISDVLREFGRVPTGGNHAAMKQRLERHGIDTSHFLGQRWQVGRTSRNRQDAAHFLKEGRVVEGRNLRRSLVEIGRPYVCEDCGQGDQWNGCALTLEVDHKNRVRTDNRPENLRFLCPYCHSQYGARTAVEVVRHACVSQLAAGATLRT